MARTGNYAVLKESQWIQVIQECNRSGEKKKEWCKSHNVAYSTFCRKQRNLREQLAGTVIDGTDHAIVPLQIASESVSFKGKASVAPTTESVQQPSEISIQKGDLLIRIPSTVSATYLATLIKEIC